MDTATQKLQAICKKKIHSVLLKKSDVSYNTDIEFQGMISATQNNSILMNKKSFRNFNKKD